MALEGTEPVDADVRRAYAAGVGASGAPLDDGSVVVVERPGDHWGYVAFGAAFASGTVACAEASLLDAARAAAPEQHSPAALLEILSAVRDHAVVEERDVTLHAPGIGWALGDRWTGSAEMPDGRDATTLDAHELTALVDDGRFPNGAGRSDRADGRSFRNQYGVLVADDDGDPLAVAGVFLTYGLHEIGVDVVPDARGHRLGRSIVAAAVDEILSRGEVPFYGCSATNIVSQRTAMSVGFEPVVATAFIS